MRATPKFAVLGTAADSSSEVLDAIPAATTTTTKARTPVRFPATLPPATTRQEWKDDVRVVQLLQQQQMRCASDAVDPPIVDDETAVAAPNATVAAPVEEPEDDPTMIAEQETSLPTPTSGKEEKTCGPVVDVEEVEESGCAAELQSKRASPTSVTEAKSAAANGGASPVSTASSSSGSSAPILLLSADDDDKGKEAASAKDTAEEVAPPPATNNVERDAPSSNDDEPSTPTTKKARKG